MNTSVIMQGVRRALNGIKMLNGRGRVLLVDDSGPVQMLQAKVSAKETMTIPRLAEFGFASRPPAGTDVAIIFLSGERTWGTIVGSNNQTYRFKLENDGEMAVHDAFGKSIWFKKTAGIVVESNGQPITVNDAKGVTINTTDNVILNMGGKNVTVNNPGAVQLTGAGGRKVVCDGDPVVGGVVQAAAGQKVTAT
jgi:phage gp45-like